MIAAMAADQKLVHRIKGQRLIEDVIVDAVIGLVDSGDGGDVRHREDLLARDGCCARWLNLHTRPPLLQLFPVVIGGGWRWNLNLVAICAICVRLLEVDLLDGDVAVLGQGHCHFVDD